MAKIDKLTKSMGLPMNIKRGNPWPLDASSVWYSYAEMKAYAEKADGVAYVGQILALVDETGNSAEAYIIVDQNGTLKPVGAGPLVDNKTIEIDADSETLMLKDFGKRFYKYIPEEKNAEGAVIRPASYSLTEVSESEPWKAGLEVRVALEGENFVLGWYEPNPTTIEGVNNQVAGLQSTIEGVQKSVSDIEREIGAPVDGETPASGLYAELDKKANAADVYSKAETTVIINNAVAEADHLRRKIIESYSAIVSFIEEKGAAEAAKYIFMVPETDTTADGNIYEEYLVIDGVIEVVGKWATDLSDYVTSDDLETALEDYDTSSEVDEKLAGYATSTALQSLIDEVAGVKTSLSGKVDVEEGSRLISSTEIDKLNALVVDAEKNVINSVSADFTVTADRELILNKDAIDLANNTTLKEVKGVADEAKSLASTNSASLKLIQQSVDANTLALENLAAADAVLSASIKKNEEAISGLQESVGSIEDSIEALNNSVQDNKDSISSITAQLNNFVLQSQYDEDIAEIRDILTWKTLNDNGEIAV